VTALGVLAMSIATLSACRQIVDFRDEPQPDAQTGMPTLSLGQMPPDAGANACGLGYGTESCADCIRTNCCEESNTCATDTSCSPYESCAGACAGDPRCRVQCAIDFPPINSDDGPALDACLATHCEGDCGLTCGGAINANSYIGGPPEEAAACESCIQANGCDAARACGASAQCAAFRRCWDSCATQDCKTACYSFHDPGPDWASFKDTIGGSCAVACGRGSDWSCVGRVSWPRPKADTVTFTIEVKDYVSGSTFSNVDVSLCSRMDVDCQNPVAHGSTGPAGRVVLSFREPTVNSFLGLDGYVQVTSPDIIPYRFYWGGPLSESHYELIDQTVGNIAIRLFTPNDAKQLGASIGIPYDPNATGLIAGVNDCELHASSGVQVAAEPTSPAVKEAYGLSRTAMATDMSNPYALIAYLPEGSVDVVATPLALGKASSRQTVTVRKGWFTFIDMLPTP
jgi:hypothetical protein